MYQHLKLKNFLAIFMLMLLSVSASFAANFTSVITGNWRDGATWGNASPGAAGVDYPSATDNATVAAGTTVRLTANESIVDLTIESGAVMDAFTNDKTLTIDGKLDNDGTLMADNKDIIFTGGGVTSIDGLGVVTINNGGKKFKISGNTSFLSTSDIWFFCEVEIQNNIVVTNNGIVTIDDDLSGRNGNSEWVNAASSTLNIKKRLLQTGILTSTANGNTVVYYGGNQDIKDPVSSTYYNLSLSGEKTKTQLTNLIVTNDISLLSSEYDCASFTTNVGGDWINTGGSFTEGTGSVVFDGGVAQSITTFFDETYYDWELKGGGTLTISSANVIVANTMTMTSGNVVTGSNKITLGTAPGSAGTLAHTSGTIIGYFERWLPTTTGVTYLFPLGTSANYNPGNITFNTIGNNGSLIGRFVAVGPGNNGLSLVDGATTIYNSFVDGYWEFTTANSFAASDFNLELTGNGFTGFIIDANTRILTRANAAAAWTADGTHSAAVGNTAKRNNVTTISGHYCFGDDTNCSSPVTPTITSADTDPCTSSSGTYTVTNTGNTYTWSISPASAGSFNPAPAAGDFSVNIDWGATGQVAYVICKESNACTSSDPDTLAVNVHSIAPSSITGKLSVAKATLGEPYSVTALAGYTYTWSVVDGTIASGQGTSAITVDWDNTVGTGSVSVIAQSGGGCAAAGSFGVNVKRYEVVNSNGTGGGDWHTASTWDCNCVPQITDNVRILTGDTVTQSAKIEINHMILKTQGALTRTTVNQDIIVTGDLTNHGYILMSNGNKDLKLEGIGTTIDGVGLISATAGAEVQAKNGNKTISSTANLTISGADFNIKDAGLVITNNGTITITNDILVRDATDTWINSTNSTLNIGGDLFIGTGATLSASSTGNTVNYNGTIAQTMQIPSGNVYYNLTASGSNTKTGQSNLDINGDLLIDGTAQLDPANFSYTLAGNWTNTSGNADPFVEGTGTVTFDGTLAQTITSAAGETFNNLVINNTSTGVTLAALSNVTVTGAMTFTDGIVDSRTNSVMVIIANGASVASASNASYVKGFVRKVGNTAFEFPVGDGGEFAPSSISAPGVATDAFDSEYYYSGGHDAGYDTTLRDLTLHHLSENEYWMVNRTIGASNVTVTLSWNDPRSGGVTVLGDLAVARWDGAKWVDHSNGGTTGTTTTGTVTSLGVVTAFSPFTLGSVNSNNPLPIELLSFNATLNKDVVELEWTTASEINNDYYTIERSVDGVKWEEVFKVDGAGTSNNLIKYFEIDYEPLEGMSYYRIKQTDFNGYSSTSGIVPINYIIESVEEQTMLLFPNPNDGLNVNVQLNGFDSNEVLIIVRNVKGQELYSKAIVSQREGVVELLTLDNRLPEGMYIITASSEQKFVSKKLLVKSTN